MATEKEEVIFEFKIDQGSALRDLENIEKAILNNKEAQKELNDAYKKGVITQNEYIKENVRLQQNLKKEQEQKKVFVKLIETESNSINALTRRNQELKKERNNLDLTTEKGIKQLSLLNSQIDKNDKLLEKNLSLMEKQKLNIGNYSSALDKFLPGTEKAVGAVTGLTGSLGGTIGAIQKTGLSFQTLNTVPIVALISSAIAVFDLLKLSVEASSKEFLKQFDYIQKQEEAIASLTKQTNEYVESLSQQNEILAAIGNKDLEIIKNEEKQNTITQTQQRLKINLIKEELLLLGSREDFYKRFEAGKATDEEIKKQISLNIAIANSGKTEEEFVKSKKEELETEQKILISLLNKSTVIGVRLKNQREEDKKDLDEILKKERERLEIEKALAEANRRLENRSRGILGPIDLSDPNRKLSDKNKSESQLEEQERTKEIIEGTATFTIDSEVYLQKGLKKIKDDAAIEDAKRKQAELELTAIVEQKKFDIVAGSLSSIASVLDKESEEYKIIASAVALMDTYKAANAALASGSEINVAYGVLAAAAAVAAGLANVASINGVQFAQGGYTGPGYGRPDSSGFKPAGIVHENEYVAPKWIVNSSAGSYHVNALESMRLRGYADGGLVTSSATQETNAAVAQMNALKNLPPVELSIVEYEKKAKRLRIKENLSRLKR